MTAQQKFIPNLWFKDDAEEAVAFYISVFGGKELARLLYPEGMEHPSGLPASDICTIDFEVQGTRMTAINGGTDPQYTDSCSLLYLAEDQAELDRIWQKLLDGGGKGLACGWISDRWGMRWQIVPKSFDQMLGNLDATATTRVFEAMYKMVKLDGPALEAAAYGKAA